MLSDEKYLEMQAVVQKGNVVNYRGRSACTVAELDNIIQYAKQEDEAAQLREAEEKAKRQATIQQVAISEAAEIAFDTRSAGSPEAAGEGSEGSESSDKTEETGEQTTGEQTEGNDTAAGEGSKPSESSPSPLSMHSVAVLREMAAGYGVTGLAGKSKAELIEAIEAAQSNPGSDDNL